MSSTHLRFRVLGRELTARNLPTVHDWLQSRWCFPEHDVAPVDYRITLDLVDRLEPLTDCTTHTARIPGFTLIWQHRGTTWHTATDRAGIRLTLERGHARILLRLDPAADHPGDALLAALYTALSEALRASGLIPLHAAAIARRGSATLLFGPSGTGKTTTLLQALRRGWAPVAEDLVWLDPVSRMVHGWDRGVRLWPPDTEGILPGIADHAWELAPDGKRFLPWERLPAARVPTAPLRRIVLLDRSPERAPGIEPLSRYERIRAIWEATGVPLDAASRDLTAAALPRLERSVAVCRLRLPELEGREAGPEIGAPSELDDVQWSQ